MPEWIIKKEMIKKWMKHSMVWVNEDAQSKIKYRPVNLKTNTKEIKTIEPKARVY